MKFRNIEILEKHQNKKGDLFGRLMSDLFHTLGYDEPRLNIHKSGREIDLNARHRTESKIALAECKAHSETIGGADINKFIGVIDVEKRKIKKDKSVKGYSVVGYFISLSGFKETAIEQENEVDNRRIILIKPEKIVEELIRGRILVSKEHAISSLSALVSGLTLLDYVDLFAFEKGWIWAFYFSNSSGQQASHFALVHAEGKPLIKNLADIIVSIDSTLNKKFEGLSLINKDESTKIDLQKLATTSQKYFKYLENELGEIHFEGLPTDKEAGSVKVKLENIFVPLHLSKSSQQGKKEQIELDTENRESIGGVLNKNPRLAILAKPGAGKSTLIKRIAIAYAFAERRKQIKDSLPERNWFPIFLRCRELGDMVTRSITEIINNIPVRAEIPSCTNDFSILVSDALQNGNALLLVDGLDEISEDKNRIAFVNQLRTFIATYPTLNIIVTSREAGFRVVAGSLASYCENYTVSNLNNAEIEELCLKWHKAIIDETDNTIKDANKLIEIILKDSRIRVLAENPLLLTTLLFVKRWAGYLPTKRSVLYQEMIKLLLVTWNVEGHEILDIEEAEPQLAFVAYWMTKNGQQTISADELNNCLIEARRQMPEILGYTNITPSEFIKRVESRSSLLIMSGHTRLVSGQISAIYEFLHLSFQEYLTAKAIVKKFIPQTDFTNKVIDIIKPNIYNENWKEVIPLTAVLLERDTKELIEYLIEESKLLANVRAKNKTIEINSAPFLLGSCLANEIQINPELLGVAIEWYAKNHYSIFEKINTEIILKNKFGTAFRKKVRECYFDQYDDKFAPALGSTLSDIFLTDLKSPENRFSIPSEILSCLKSGSKEDKCIAILGMMSYAYSYRFEFSYPAIPEIEEIFNLMFDLFKKDDSHYQFSICWSLAWAGEANIFPDSQRVRYINVLAELWTKSNEYNFQRMISWALSKIAIPSINKEYLSKIKQLKTKIHERYQSPDNQYDKLTSIYLGTIVGENFEKKGLNEFFNSQNNLEEIANEQSSLYLFMKELKIQKKITLKGLT